MSVVAEAAAIIGVTDASIKSINRLYTFFQTYNDVPEDLAHIRVEISHIQARISQLDSISQADERTVLEVQETGITEVMNECGAQCDKLEKMLAKWVKHSGKSSGDRLRIALNQAKIQKYRIVLWSAARELDSAVGILTLRMTVSNRSPENQTAELESLMKAMTACRLEADGERNSVSLRLAEIGESSDDEAEYIEHELEEQNAALYGFMKRCDATVGQLQAMTMDQDIKDVYIGDNAHSQVGISKDTNKSVRQKIGNVRATGKSISQIGIY